jgi:hypothetical protein
MSIENVLPFETAKALSVHNLEYLIQQSIELNQKYGGLGFQQDIQNLNSLQQLIQGSDEPCLQLGQIDHLLLFAHHLINSSFNKRYFRNADFSSKLERFWKILFDLSKQSPQRSVDIIVAVAEKRNGALHEKAGKFIQKIGDVNKITSHFLGPIKHMLDQGHVDILVIGNILLSWVIRAETHEYYVKESLSKANSILGATYDIEDICSVESKVMQNTRPQTDINAIRDAISHCAFSLDINGGIFVDFHSNERGFNYNRRFKDKELIMFLEYFYKLAGIQEVLFRISLLYSILLIHFKTP